MMFSLTRFFSLLVLIPVFFSCTESDLGPAPFPDDYQAQFNEWHDERLESLTNPTGWMRLAGLYWLEEGGNSFGSGDTVDIRFPEGTIADYAGTFILQDNQVIIQSADNVGITYEGEPVNRFTLYDGEESFPVESGSLHWVVIQRGNLTGIRLYNKENSRVDAFTGFERFEIDPEWYVKARFLPKAEGSTIPIVNILGQMEDTPSPATLEFMIDGERYTLDALEGTDQMFLIVGDQTNKMDTYQAGRYLYVDYPEAENDYTVIDFNKLYNPPCSYNLFSTCQLPPPQNRLEVAISAGEKRPTEWSGI